MAKKRRPFSLYDFINLFVEISVVQTKSAAGVFGSSQGTEKQNIQTGTQVP